MQLAAGVLELRRVSTARPQQLALTKHLSLSRTPSIGIGSTSSESSFCEEQGDTGKQFGKHMKTIISIAVAVAVISLTNNINAQTPAPAATQATITSLQLAVGAPVILNGVLCTVQNLPNGQPTIVPMQAATVAMAAPAPAAQTKSAAAEAAPAAKSTSVGKSTSEKNLGQHAGDVLQDGVVGAGEGAVLGAVTGRKVGKEAAGMAAGKGAGSILNKGINGIFGGGRSRNDRN